MCSRCVLGMFDSKPGWVSVWCCVLVWAGLSDVCQNQMNQIDILISQRLLGGPSLHLFLSVFVFSFHLFYVFMHRHCQELDVVELDTKGDTVWIHSVLLWLANHTEEPVNQIIRFFFLTCHGSIQTSDL